MKTLTPGHKYELENFEAKDQPGQMIQFIEKTDDARVAAWCKPWALRTRNYRPATIKAYVGCVLDFVLFHGRRDPRTLGAAEVQALPDDAGGTAGCGGAAHQESFGWRLMTRMELNRLLEDWPRLVAAVRDPAVLPLLPKQRVVLEALPDPCESFQARWVLECARDHLRAMRETHPGLVAYRAGRTIRYSRAELYKMAKLVI